MNKSSNDFKFGIYYSDVEWLSLGCLIVITDLIGWNPF